MGTCRVLEAGDRSQVSSMHVHSLERLALSMCPVVGVSHRGLSWRLH